MNPVPRQLQLVYLVAITSGILLLGAAYFAALTGLCLKHPWLEGALWWLGGYPGCSYLHIEVLPGFVILLGSIHVIATAETIAAKLETGRLYRAIGTLYRTIAWLLGGTLIVLYIVLEVMLSY